MRSRALLCLAVTLSIGVASHLRADDTKQVSTPSKVVWDITRTTAPDTLDELKAMQTLLKSTVDKVMPATVALTLGQGAGSGVIVSEDGLVLTAAHVIVKPNQDVTIWLPDGKRVAGKTLGINVRNDSGMVKITGKPPKNATWPGASEGKWPTVELGKASDLKKGQYVISLGHPGGPKPDRKPPVRLGQFINSQQIGRAIRTDCTLVGGDSGGPLFDMSGKLIGIHSRIGLDLETNIHIPTEAFKDDWEKFVKAERVGQEPPSIFGVKFNEADDSPEVLEVTPESPADNAGISKGDRIVKFNGNKVERANDVYEMLFDIKPGTKVKIEYRRGNDVTVVETALAARPRQRRNNN